MARVVPVEDSDIATPLKRCVVDELSEMKVGGGISEVVSLPFVFQTDPE